MRQPFVLRTFLAAGVMMLGNSLAQTSPARLQTAPSGKTRSSTAAKKKTSASYQGAGTSLTTDKQKMSYALGMNLGANLHRQSVDIDPNLFLQGMQDAMSGGKTLLTQDEVHAALLQYQSEVRARQEAKARAASAANKKEAEAFLAANKTKDGVMTLSSGLQYKVLRAGTGPRPRLSDTVVCNYRGTLIDGTEFDSSYKRGQPAKIKVGGVIQGWTEALQRMPVGSKWQIFIPSDLAYGEGGTTGGEIGPSALLIFEVELISIEPANPAPAPDKK